MRRFALISISLAVAVSLSTTATAAASPSRFFIGKGDAHKTKVSFRVVDGEIKDGLVESHVHLKGHAGPQHITAFGGFSASPIGARDRFKCIVEADGNGTTESDYTFTFAGRVVDGTAFGRTSTRTVNGIANFRTGHIGWDATAVSRSEYEDFAGFGNAVIEHGGRPACR